MAPRRTDFLNLASGYTESRDVDVSCAFSGADL